MPLKCFYCRKYGDRHVQIFHLFGIISCELHKPDAVRDCNRYLHYRKRARLTDVLAHPDTKPFFDALPATFPTIRSSGARDDGWMIPTGSWASDILIGQTAAGDWYMPIDKVEANGDRFQRSAPFKSFLDAGVPGVTAERVAALVAVLDAGIYLADVNAAAPPASAAGAGVAPAGDADGVLSVLVDGRPCRIIDENGSVAAQLAAGGGTIITPGGLLVSAS